jgi:hypothetical protein
MKLEELYRFATAQGMRILEGESCLWVEKRKFFLESTPPHRRVHLRSGEAARLFLRGVAAVRFTCDETEGSPSFEYVWDDKKYDLDSLAKDAKRNVRLNLESCAVRRIEFGYLAQKGCAINRSVLARQGRSTDSFLTNEESWKGYMSVCETLSFLEAYGAFVEDQLCAFIVTLRLDDVCYTYHPHALAEYRTHYPMNVLLYSVVKTMLARPGISCVSYGLESFAARPTLERFKLAMGCRKRPIGRRLMIHPLARPLFSQRGARIAQHVLRRVKPGLVDDFCTFTQAVQNQHARVAAV